MAKDPKIEQPSGIMFDDNGDLIKETREEAEGVIATHEASHESIRAKSILSINASNLTGTPVIEKVKSSIIAANENKFWNEEDHPQLVFISDGKWTLLENNTGLSDEMVRNIFSESELQDLFMLNHPVRSRRERWAEKKQLKNDNPGFGN